MEMFDLKINIIDMNENTFGGRTRVTYHVFKVLHIILYWKLLIRRLIIIDMNENAFAERTRVTYQVFYTKSFKNV